MITSFEVGAVFKIINEASPALRTILRQVRELNVAIDKARENLALLSRSAVSPSLSKAVAETDGLAKAWGDVAKNAKAAQAAIGSASSRAARVPGAAAAVGGSGGGGGGGGRGGRRRPGWLGGGGAHISGPGASLPGGGHIRVGGRMGGGAMATAGLLGYGVYEAAEMEDAVWQLIYHSGLDQNDANRSKFRKVLQDSMAESGYGLHDVSESAKQEIRMFQGTPGGGIDVLPEMLRAATIEARVKGESPEESMKALIGLAHMTKQYSPEAIKKLAPAFAFLSTANPGSLGSIERAAGYAVPLLQSGLEIDPMQSLLLGTALTRAGATSTKSGTWLREMALRAMPGTSMMSKMAFKKHEEALKAFGLVDDKDKPTWFTDGKPDIFKMLDIAGGKAASIPIEKRAAYERALFGAQGGSGFALLSDPAVREQVQTLMKEMNSPAFKARYAGFADAYKQGSTVQNARTTMADFNNLMADLGAHILPSVNGALRDFKSVLETLRGLVPGAKKDGEAPAGVSVGKTALEGAAAGAVAGAAWGAFGGPVGAVGGAVLGGIGGGALGVAQNYMLEHERDKKERPGDRYARRIENLQSQNGGAPKATLQPLSLSLNLDGRTLAQAMSTALAVFNGFPTQAPAADGTGQFYSGDHNYPDK